MMNKEISIKEKQITDKNKDISSKSDSNEIKNESKEIKDEKNTIINKDLNDKSLNNKNSSTINKFSSISTYNGDECDIYNWSQGSRDVQIQIKLPLNTSAKMVI